MPRGTETQEPQEGREIKQEPQEVNPESERTKDVVEQPQAVIEQERSVQESEEIEREIVEAVEAVGKDGEPETGEDRGPKTEDREDKVPTDEEISATPINTPGSGDEISATPINTPGGVDQVDLSPDDVKLDESSLETGDREQIPTQPIIEKELPEGGQMEEGLDQREDLQDIMDGDHGSLMPGGGEIVGADGKKVGGSKFGDELGNLPVMGAGGKIDGSPEDPSGDQFPGKGLFKPGKGPGGGTTETDVPGAQPSSTWTTDERQAYVDGKAGVSEKTIAAKEKALQEKALDGYVLQQAIVTGKLPDPKKPKKGAKNSSPDGEEGGSDVKAVSQEEFDAVIDKVDGGQISTHDPDDQSGEVPDRLTPEGAKKVKDAMDMAASTKHKQKKAGSEVVTDPDQEDQDDKGGGGRLGKKLEL